MNTGDIIFPVKTKTMRGTICMIAIRLCINYYKDFIKIKNNIFI